ncbi:MAG: competence/damage-inducible protein A [Elusimicrobiota bacterium]
MNPRAEIICVGSELLAGVPNTHLSFLGPRLSAAGFDAARECTVPDDEDEIREAVADAACRAELVLVSGGLGPTFDDITREGVAAALGRRLIYEPRLYTRIRRQYARCRMTVSESNKRQAKVIEGAKVIPNALGTAPGQFVESGQTLIVLLPGPPRELRPMFERKVLPELLRRFGRRRGPFRRLYRICGLTEASVGEQALPLLRGLPGVELTILSGRGLVDLYASARLKGGARQLGLLEKRIKRRFGAHAYGTGEDSLESVVGARMRALGWKLAVAESCTGGLLAGKITAVPGSSEYFLGGVVAYNDSIKHSVLGVPKELLRRHGAVSSPIARRMAEGARRRFGSDAAVSITGIAGPGGGSRKKPTGLVFIGISTPRETVVLRSHFAGDRNQIRQRAATAALFELLRQLPL